MIGSIVKLTLLLSLALAAPAPAGRVIHVDGTRLVLTDIVASQWSSIGHLERLPSSPSMGVKVAVHRLLAGTGTRIDLFDRTETGCIWAAAFRGPAEVEFAIAPSARAQCILVRNGPLYGLATTIPGDRAVRLGALRDIQPLSNREQVLFVEGEDEPRVLEREGGFAAVPAVAALICEWGEPDPDQCARIEAHELKPSSVSLSSASGVRVVDASAELTPRVLSEARSALAPRKESVRTISAGTWRALAIDLTWERVIVDWSQDGRATVRSSASDLRPLPSFQRVTSVSTSGVAVRPLLGEDGEVLVEAEAQLAFFSERPDVAGRIAVAVVGGDEHGVFRAVQLAPGEYRLKLMSAVAADAVVRATAHSDVTDVRFPTGPLVRGRIVMRATAPTSDRPVIRIMALAPEATSDPAVPIDPAQLAREVRSDQEGAFRVSVPAGDYILRATWAGGTAERLFRADGRRDVDLGNIELTRAVSLRGTVAGCDGGEIRLTPLPSPNRRTALPLFDRRRSAIHEGGTFEIASLWPGQWLASARCGGEERLLMPQIVDVPENAQADVIVQFAFEKQ
jgi:hypothetical protein